MSMFECYLDGNASINDLLFQLFLQADENTVAIEQVTNAFRSYPIAADLSPGLIPDIISRGLSSYSNFPELIQGIHEMSLRTRDAISILQTCAPPRRGPDEPCCQSAPQQPAPKTRGEEESVRDRARRFKRS